MPKIPSLSLNSQPGVIPLRDIALTLAIGIGLTLILLRDQILPERFLGDETTIQQLAQQLWETPGDPSYDRVADIYRFFALANAPLIAGFLGLSVSILPYFVIIRLYPWRRTFVPLAILVGGILLSAVYLGSYSKEVFVIPIVLLVILLPPKKRSVVAIALGMCAYAALFREYWYMSAIVFIILCAIKDRFRSSNILFLLCFLGVLLGSIAFAFVMGVPSDFYRSSVNAYREGFGDANSLITRYVQFPEPIGGAANNALSFVFLQIPFPLALKGSVYYFALFLIFTLLWTTFYYAIQQKRLAGLNSGQRALIYRVSAFILSFIVTQAFFEPDYGSALKHLTPMLSLFLLPWLVENAGLSRSENVDERKRVVKGIAL